MVHKLNSEVMKEALVWKPRTISTTGKQTQTITVLTGKHWVIQSMRLEYTTPASTASVNRQIACQFLSSTNGILDESIVGALQGAGLTRNYEFSPSLSDLTAFRDTKYLSTPITPMFLTAGQKIKLFDNSSKSTADTSLSRINVLERTIPST